MVKNVVRPARISAVNLACSISFSCACEQELAQSKWETYMSATLKSKDSSECRSAEEGIDPLDVQSKRSHIANYVHKESDEENARST